MVWTSANGPKCPVSPEDRDEIMGHPSQKSRGKSCECGLTGAGRCPVCLTLPRPERETP
jgi:hypothetical protein